MGDTQKPDNAPSKNEKITKNNKKNNKNPAPKIKGEKVNTYYIQNHQTLGTLGDGGTVAYVGIL